MIRLPMIALATAGLLAAGSAAADSAARVDPYFGEALYYAHQERFFEALERLDTELAQHYGLDEPELGSLHAHLRDAEFSVGDFELHYRMHHRAGRAIRAVLEGDVDEAVRNDAAFRLARLHFQKGQPEDALEALDGIHGRIPEGLQDDIGFLRANALMATGRPDEAVEVLSRLRSEEDLRGFTAYNLGIALLEAERPVDAVRQLDRAGRLGADDPASLAIRDKANLVLGKLWFDASEFRRAQGSLDRVRLSGPFSNEALLRAGWAELSDEEFARALVPWGLLAEREPTDAAVQEAMLALPYAYAKLDLHGRAARLYERAVRSFGSELEKIDASIGSVRSGDFLEALIREEIRQDKDWVIRMRSLPEAPETFYLTSLMASHDFQTALQNYLDLEDLRRKLVRWQGSFDAYDDLIRLRRAYYEPLLPGIDREFRKLDAQMRLRLEQREHLDRRLQQLLVGERPELLATAEEQRRLARLDALERALEEAGDPGADALRARIHRLRGVVLWDLQAHYHDRLTRAHRHLRELNDEIELLRARYDSFVRTRQAASQSYEGYDDPIRSLRSRVRVAREGVQLLMARQGHMLETVAVAELTARRDRLEAYQNQARFAFADSYDRAAKAQAMGSVEP